MVGFDPQNHAALIGAIGDTRFLVGRERRFVAPSSGPLLLGVNDQDYANNSGQFDVDIVTVNQDASPSSLVESWSCATARDLS